MGVDRRRVRRYAPEIRQRPRSRPSLLTVVSGNTLDIGNVTLLVGDINGGDRINLLNVAILAYVLSLTNGELGFDSKADINSDGVVDIFDLVMVGNNFNCSLNHTTLRWQRWGRP
jgi:hypothetical protein